MVTPSRSSGSRLQRLLALGRQNPNDASENFNMAYLALRGSGAVNGVSRLHGEVSRQIFEPLFPHWPEGEVPIGYVTNGVHMPNWDSAPADDLWTEACGKDRWLGTTDALAEKIQGVSDARLWNFRAAARTSLVEYSRDRLSRELTSSGASPDDIDRAKHLFDPEALTLGFARRFATYKRPDLLLHDPQRLLRILSNSDRPVQLILAGKAHPADQGGQALIQKWVQFIRRPEVRPHAIFLSDYDMLLTEHLVQGVDVWINTPRRPWEASGTSGMKVLVNGGINLSELDGWWAEAYTPEVGWALGDGQVHGDDPAWDAVEAGALYDLLEREVIPEFYARNESGISATWVKRMRQSMARLTPQFSANRTVREYTEQRYLPAAAAYRTRAANKGEPGKQVVEWLRTVDQKWDQLQFGKMRVDTHADHHDLEVELFLGDLDPTSVRVELYAEGINGGHSGPGGDDFYTNAAQRGSRQGLSRNGTRHTSGGGLHDASDAPPLRGYDSLGIGANSMADAKYPSQGACSVPISGRSPSPPPFGRDRLCRSEPMKAGEASILPSSAVTPAGCGWSCSRRPKTQLLLEQSIWRRGATARETSGTFGWRGSHPANYTLTGWMGPTTPALAIASMSTSFSSIRSLLLCHGRPRGTLRRHAAPTSWERSTSSPAMTGSR